MTLQSTITTLNEQYRPQYHFSPATGWMNDPNGLIYYKGEYHLFYQYHPFSTVWGPMHWGHAVSPDLVHWTPLPIALYPEGNRTIFSGSAVNDIDNTSGLVPGGGLVAIFSYDDQSQGIAYSLDNGRNWTMYSSNPVIPTPGTDFRDPKVFWHAPSKHWVMIISAHDRVKFYTSPNLITWTLVSEFGDKCGAHEGIWECPDLFSLMIDDQTKWVLIVSVSTGAPAGGSGTQYFIGDFDGTSFTNDNAPGTILWLDYGKDNYAALTWNRMPDNSRVLMGWMNNWQYAEKIPTSSWRGACTLPHTMELQNVAGTGIRVIQKPIQQLENLRVLQGNWREQVISESTANLLAGIDGKNGEIVAEFEIGTAQEFGFQIHSDDTQFTTVGYKVGTSNLFVDRTQSGIVNFQASFPGVFQAPMLPMDTRIKLHVFVDWSSVEIFGNDGLVVMTNQIFPVEGRSELELYASGGEVKLVSLDVYTLNHI